MGRKKDMSGEKRTYGGLRNNERPGAECTLIVVTRDGPEHSAHSEQ